MKKLTKFNEFINESAKPHLLIYRGNTVYPYNYTVIKGDELYSVSFRKDKPFLFKYHGMINRDNYNPNGVLVKNPSKALIMLAQTKLKSSVDESKMNEEFEGDPKNMPSADRVSFMIKLKEEAEETLKKYPKDFKLNVIPGKILTIGTENPNDLRMVVKFSGDKITFNAKPTVGPEYEFAYNFDKEGVEQISNLIKIAIENDPYKGIIPKSKETYPSDTDEPAEEIREEEIEPLDVPITKKKAPKRVRSININVIQDVLEDAYILDDIDLKDTPVEELVRRMLLETRSRTKKK